jgi:phosphoribosyl 1,2-cyclic phosphodiesterase
LQVDGFGLLIDCGLHPRTLSSRLAAVGVSWEKLHAVILTHTHGDHWKDLCFEQFRNRRIPLYAHTAHLDHLSIVAPSFAALHAASLTRSYRDTQVIDVVRGLTCRAVEVSHDSDPTFAFRLDYRDGDNAAWSIGYASDLGCGSGELVDAFTGVDVLALEYNHDEKMERASSRPAYLVQRVLGDRGHLSNRQAADLTRTIAANGGNRLPHHLVQLHLSKDCNHPHLAESAGRNALADVNPAVSVITAKQDMVARTIFLNQPRDTGSPTSEPPARVHVPTFPPLRVQPVLPGFEPR